METQKTDKAGFLIKTPEQHFADWEGHVFGFGYGTGDPYTLAALKTFLSLCNEPPLGHSCDYRKLEEALTPTVAWLLINALARKRIIEYGSSPRFVWLTKTGERLKAFVGAHTVERLYEMTGPREDACYPDACNCGPGGYAKGRKCPNPFWCDEVDLPVAAAV